MVLSVPRVTGKSRCGAVQWANVVRLAGARIRFEVPLGGVSRFEVPGAEAGPPIQHFDVTTDEQGSAASPPLTAFLPEDTTVRAVPLDHDLPASLTSVSLGPDSL